MKEKLTLTIDKEIKQRAKRHAKATGHSVSEVVEEFLDNFSEEEPFQPEPGSVTESLMGSLKLPKRFDNMDYKQIKEQMLREKYYG